MAEKRIAFITLKIGEEKAKKFKLLCQFNGENQSIVIKRLIDEYLEKNAAKVEMLEKSFAKIYAKMQALDKSDEKNEESGEGGENDTRD